MNNIPNPLTLRTISDQDVAIMRQLFRHAGRFSTLELRAAAYAKLVMVCLCARISMHDLFHREV